MDSITLPAPSLAANPPKPPKSPAAKKPALTLELVVQRWTEAHGRSVESALRLGWLAHRFLQHRLRSATDAGERRRMRAAAIHEIESRLHLAGLRGDSLKVADHIRCAAAYDLLRGDCKAVPAWRALRALSPLVTRNPAKDSWSCPAERIEKVRVLFRKAAEKRISIEQIRDEVRQILGKQQKPSRRAASEPVDIVVALRRRIAAIDSLAYALEVRQALEVRIRELNPTYAAA